MPKRKRHAVTRAKSDTASKPPEPSTAPVWRSAHIIFGASHFAAAAILAIVARPSSDIGTLDLSMSGAVDPQRHGTLFLPPFALWVIGALVVLGLAWIAFGLRRRAQPQPRGARFDELHPRWFFLHTWRHMDEEARFERSRARDANTGFDWRPILTLCGGAVFLTLMEYFGDSVTFRQLLALLQDASWAGGGEPADNVWRDIQTSRFYRLSQFAWWSGWRVLGYFLLPAAIIKMTGGKVRDHGLETAGFASHAWIYVFGYYVVFICVVTVSYTNEFSHYYPFYKLASRSGFDFLCWELLYAAQFFSLEFFFRGWWLKALKPSMGSHAIFVMIVPYCMIHYGKPFPETLGAIVAGLFLGTLAMKTRSIWSGFLIHVSVAISMDTAALLQTRGLPTSWWP